MNPPARYGRLLFAILLATVAAGAQAVVKAAPQQEAAAPEPRAKVIIDTDIGDDIDDAFALALALRSPEFEIVGITTTFGDTEARARLVERYLRAVGRANIPVAAGRATPPKATFTQHRYADGGKFDPAVHPKAADFILNTIRKYPGQITLIAIGPLVNVGDAIEKDPQTFSKMKRMVMMGGSVDRGYDTPTSQHTPAEPEWNIENDIPAAQRLFDSGVPIYMMPLDATQLKLDQTRREMLFRQQTALSDVLAVLYQEWGQATPTLYDPVAVAYALRPELCPVTPMHIAVDGQGFTRREAGSPNARVCLESKPSEFFQFYLGRLAGRRWRKR